MITNGLYFNASALSTQDKYRCLSELYEGDVITTTSDPNRRTAELYRFTAHAICLPRVVQENSLLRNICYLPYVLYKGLRLHLDSRRRIDVVLVSDPFKIGFCAWMLSRWIGAHLVIEIIGSASHAYKVTAERMSLASKLKNWIALQVTPFVLNRASAIKRLYASQLADFDNILRRDNVYYQFHEFTAIKNFYHAVPVQREILFIGYPWYLKGVDLLISAFQAIAPKYPDCFLRIVGYCPDPSYFKKLADGHPRIVFERPVEYEGVIELMARCWIFVLPSRTEAMGRVLLEAMAARKAVIASRVDGIPTYVEDGKTGLLFESENVSDLARKLELLLTNEQLRATLAENGYIHVRENYSEEQYLLEFSRMIEGACRA